MGEAVRRPVRRAYGIRYENVLLPPYSTFRCALNTANYFMSKDDYLAVWDGSVNPHTADSIYQAFNWLASGRQIKFVKDLHYFHRMHAGSHFLGNRHKTGNFSSIVEQRLCELK
jgi:hypothetical protein